MTILRANEAAKARSDLLILTLYVLTVSLMIAHGSTRPDLPSGNFWTFRNSDLFHTPLSIALLFGCAVAGLGLVAAGVSSLR